MIRSSLALSLILKKQFRMTNIRKNRPNPGINNQLRSVFSAFTDKLPKLGDFQVYFFPKFLEPTEIKAATAASITLMMQCLVPVFTCIGYDKLVKINGGTDVSRSPPLASIKTLLIPLLDRMGIKLAIEDVKPGYFPIGKGSVEIRVPKIEEIRPIKMVELSNPKKVIITYYSKENKVPGSSKQLRKDVKKLL